MDTIWIKKIGNSVDTPWLDWIVSGKKKYEGRVYQDDWKLIKIGDMITFDCGMYSATVKIIDILHFSNFKTAFNKFGSELVPIPHILEEEVDNLYSQFYSKSCINEYGVILLKLELVK